MKILYKICYETSSSYGYELVVASCISKAVSIFIKHYNYPITVIIRKSEVLI